MSYSDDPKKCGGLWLRKYLLNASPNDATSPVCVQNVRIIKHIVGPCADGSVTKQITDGDIYLNAVFAAETIKEGVRREDSQVDWSQSNVLLKVYHLRFQTEEREIVLFVTEFVLEAILDRTSFPRLLPMSYRQCPEICRKYENYCRQLQLTDGPSVSDCSMPLSHLLTQLSAAGVNRTSSRVHSNCAISDPNHMRPTDLDHFLISLEDQIKLQSIEEWLSDFVPPSEPETFPSVCNSVAMPTCDTIQPVSPSSVRFCSVGIQVSLDPDPIRPLVAEVGVAVGNSLLFCNSQECPLPPRADAVSVHREVFSLAGSDTRLDEALEALAQPVLSSESSENMSVEPVSQVPEDSIELELIFSSFSNGCFGVPGNISAFVEPVNQPKTNADQTIAQAKNDMQSVLPYQSTQIDYLSSQHVLMEPCFSLSPLPSSKAKTSSCLTDSHPVIINSENLSAGEILRLPVRELANENLEKSMHENTEKNQNCGDYGSNNFVKISTTAKKNDLDLQTCAEVEPGDKGYDDGGLVVDRNFTAASQSSNQGTENQKKAYSFKPSSFKIQTQIGCIAAISESKRSHVGLSPVDRHVESSLASSLNQDVHNLKPLSTRSWLDAFSEKETGRYCRVIGLLTPIETNAPEIPASRSDGIVQSEKCDGLGDVIPRDNQHEQRKNVPSGSQMLVCESRESEQCRRSVLLSENEYLNARCLDPLSVVSSNSLASMPRSNSCVGQHSRFGGLPPDSFGERISNSGALTTVTYCNRAASSQQLDDQRTMLKKKKKKGNQAKMSDICAPVATNDGALNLDSSVRLILAEHQYSKRPVEKERDSELVPSNGFLLGTTEASKKELRPIIGSLLPVSNKNVPVGVDRQEEFMCLSGDEEELEDGPAPKHLKIDGKRKQLKVKGGLLMSESKNPEALFRCIDRGKVVGGRKRKLFTGDRMLGNSAEKSTRRAVDGGGKGSAVPKEVASIDKSQRLEVETAMPEATSVRANVRTKIPAGGKPVSNQHPASKDVESHRTEIRTEKVAVADKLGKKLKKTLKEIEIASKALEINLVQIRAGGLREKQDDAKKSHRETVEERNDYDNVPSTSDFVSRSEIDYNPIDLNSNASDTDDVERSSSTIRVLKTNCDVSANTSGHCLANQKRSKPLHSKHHVPSSIGAADLIEQENALHSVKSAVALGVAGGDRDGNIGGNVRMTHTLSRLVPRQEQSPGVLGNQSVPCLSNASVASSQGAKSSNELPRFEEGRLTLPTPKNSFPSHQPLQETVRHGGDQSSLDRGIQSSGLSMDRLKVLLGRDQMTAEQAGLLDHANFPDNLKWRAYNYCKNLSLVSKHRDC